MSWTSGFPQEGRWQERDLFAYYREIYRRMKFGSFTWNPANVPANSTVDTTLTTTDSADIDGLRDGMAISVTPPSNITAGIVWGAWVANDDTLTVRLVNVTGSGIDLGSGTWAFQGMVL